MDENPLHLVPGSKIKIHKECIKDSCKTELSYLVANLIVRRERIAKSSLCKKYGQIKQRR